MKCKACKTKIKEKEATFCPFCGEPLKKVLTTDISIILDRSGSMDSIKEATIAGFNKFLKEQKEVPYPATISLYQFDDVYDVVYESIDLNEAPYLDEETFVPRNMTALYDAIGKTINRRNGIIKNNKNPPDNVLICIITDGEENASREFNRNKIYDMIKKYRDELNWQFSFVGVGIDAYKEGNKISIARGSTMYASNTSKGVSGLFNTHSNATVRYRAGAQSFLYDNGAIDEEE